MSKLNPGINSASVEQGVRFINLIFRYFLKREEVLAQSSKKITINC
jgi:hypothetical protein